MNLSARLYASGLTPPWRSPGTSYTLRVSDVRGAYARLRGAIYRRGYRPWAELLKRTFGIDVETCPRVGSQGRVPLEGLANVVRRIRIPPSR
jgi:hypothetical protein